jgi:hypothetical protein
MSDITTSENRMPVTQQPNPFEEVGRQAPRNIVGQLLKFNKGSFVYGQDNIDLPFGTRFIANMDQLLHGWIRWESNKPAEQVMGLIAEGFVPPKRDALGFGYKPGDKEEDADQSQWLVDASSGQTRDPWQFAFYMLLRELDKDNVPIQDDNGLYTFATQSKGGIDAVRGFCSVYGKWLRFHPDDYPILTIGYDQYEHPNPQYGWIKTPQFLTGYTSPEQMRIKKKVKLFDAQDKNSWAPKTAFGTVDAAGNTTSDDIPF